MCKQTVAASLAVVLQEPEECVQVLAEIYEADVCKPHTFSTPEGDQEKSL